VTNHPLFFSQEFRVLDWLKQQIAKDVSVDGVMFAFSQLMNKLDSVSEHHICKSHDKQELIRKLTDEVELHSDEAIRAIRVRERLTSLMHGI
jgi:hypothetical protein